MLRKIFGSKKAKVTGVWRKLHSEAGENLVRKRVKLNVTGEINVNKA
jgi:hypothetical protein